MNNLLKCSNTGFWFNITHQLKKPINMINPWLLHRMCFKFLFISFFHCPSLFVVMFEYLIFLSKLFALDVFLRFLAYCSRRSFYYWTDITCCFMRCHQRVYAIMHLLLQWCLISSGFWLWLHLFLSLVFSQHHHNDPQTYCQIRLVN